MTHLIQSGQQALYAVPTARRIGSVFYTTDSNELHCTLQNFEVPPSARFYVQSPFPCRWIAPVKHRQNMLQAAAGNWALLLGVWDDCVQVYCPLQRITDIAAAVANFQQALFPAAPPVVDAAQTIASVLPQTPVHDAPASNDALPNLHLYPAGPAALQAPNMRCVAGRDGRAYWLWQENSI